jgi:hypothetical protein
MSVPEPIIARLVDFGEGVKRRNLNPFEFSEKALLSGENVELQQPALMTRRGIKPLGSDAAGEQTLLGFSFDTESNPPGDLAVSETITDGSITGTVMDPGGRILAGNAVVAWDENGLYVAANQTGNSDAVWVEFAQQDEWFLDGDFTLEFYFYDLECNYTRPSTNDNNVQIIAGPGWRIEYSQGYQGCGCESEELVLYVDGDDSDSWEMHHLCNAYRTWNEVEFESYWSTYGAVQVRCRLTRVGDTWTMTTVPVDVNGDIPDDPAIEEYETSGTHATTFDDVSASALVIGKAWTVYWKEGCTPPEVDPLDAGLYITSLSFERTTVMDTTVDDGVIPALKHVRFPSNNAAYLVFQTQDPSDDSNTLWCVEDDLPVVGEQPTYTSLYDLGTAANVVDMAVLNDRCIITDGAKNNPLVFMGCLSTDGSDWAKPLLALLSPDGEVHYDITAAVLDTDSDNVAVVGDLDENGYIAVCCDVPLVSGFRFELGTGNSKTEADETTLIALIEDNDDIERQDLSGDIARWIRDQEEGTEQNLGAAAVVDNGGAPNTVNIYCMNHGYGAGDTIVIEGTVNYDGIHVLPTQSSGTAHYIEIVSAYTAETPDGSETVQAMCAGHFEAAYQELDNAAAVDNGGAPNTVNIPCTGHGYVAGDVIEIDDTDNYDGTYTLPTQTSGDADNIEIESAYSAETFDGDETVAQRMTLGSGNDAPLVEAGLMVSLSSTDTPHIVGWFSDGEQDGEVVLSADHDDGTVGAIYGVQVTDRGVHPILDGTGWTTVYEPSPTYGLNQPGLSGEYSIRQVIPVHSSGVIGNKIRITIESTYGTNQTSGRLSTGGTSVTRKVTRAGFLALDMSIVEQDSGANGTETPTQLIENASITYNGEDTSVIVSDSADGETQLPVMDYEYDASNSYLVIADLGTGQGFTVDVSGIDEPYTENNCAAIRTDVSGTYYYKANTQSYDDDTVTGFTTMSGAAIVSKLEVAGGSPVLTSQHVMVTKMYVAGVEEFRGVDVDQNTPTATTIYHCVSFDLGQNWYIWKSDQWHAVARNNSGTWEYHDGSSWQSASDNTMMQALNEAMADSDNQWEKAGLEALDQDDWHDTDGFSVGFTTEVWFAAALTASSTRYSSISSYEATIIGSGQTLIERWKDGSWDSQTWTDGTEDGGVSFAQTGNVVYNDTGNYSDSDYGAVDGQPGYWWRFRYGYGFSSDATINKVLFKAPTQPLRNIGSKILENVMSFVVEDVSNDSLADYAEYVSDYTAPSTAPIYYDGDTPEALGSSDAIYIGYAASPFVEMEITLAPTGANTAGSFSMYYWNGKAWASLVHTDKTRGFHQNGRLRWAAPSDWKKGRIDVGNYPVGYWVKLVPTSDMSTTCEVAEAKILPQPPALVKYDHCAVLKDRLVLGKRSDAPDQVDVSRALEEYGFSGSDSYSLRVGGEDGITGLFTAWNNVFIAKPTEAALLVESGDVSATRLEVGHTPVNAKVVVRAPMGGISDSGDVSQQGLFFINTEGAFVYSGLQADQSFGTARSQFLSSDVDWWDEDATYRIDTDNLHIACGAYWAERHWIVWSVPWITDGETPQTTNNRLIVYDLALRAWLPPMTATLASLATAYHYNANAANKLGKQGLYGGGYDGLIYRLFAFDDDFDTTELIDEDIDAYAETGWLDFGDATWFKQLRSLTVFAKAEGTDGDITVKVYVDGLTTQDSMSPTFENCQNLSGQEAYFDYTKINIQGRWFKFRLEFTGPTRVYAVVAELGFVRRWPSG